MTSILSLDGKEYPNLHVVSLKRSFSVLDGDNAGRVMTGAMTLNWLLAALMGVLIPMTLARLGRDPALGSSVLITAMTDSGGFFIFLGLATLFLL